MRVLIGLLLVVSAFGQQRNTQAPSPFRRVGTIISPVPAGTTLNFGSTCPAGAPASSICVGGKVYVVGGTFAPFADSTTGIKFTKSDGTSTIMSIDTTNSRVSINNTGSAPATLWVVGPGGAVAGATAPILALHTGQTADQGFLGSFGPYVNMSSDSGGAWYVTWGTHYSGATSAWVRDYGGALPSTGFGISTVGDFFIHSDPSTAGGVPSYTKRLMIAPNGNVGISISIAANITERLAIAAGNILLDNNQGLKFKTTGGATVQGMTYNASNQLVFGANNEIVLGGIIGLNGAVVDNAAAVGNAINTSPTLTTPGSKIASFRTGGTEKSFVAYDGSLGVGVTAFGTLGAYADKVAIESNGVIRADRTGVPSQYTELSGGSASTVPALHVFGGAKNLEIIVETSTTNAVNPICFKQGVAGSLTTVGCSDTTGNFAFNTALMVGITGFGAAGVYAVDKLAVEVNGAIRSDRVGINTQYIEMVGGALTLPTLHSYGAGKSLVIVNESSSTTTGQGIAFNQGVTGSIVQLAAFDSVGNFTSNFQIRSREFVAMGAPPALSANTCGANTQTGAETSGKLVSQTTGTCTFDMSFASAPPTGWNCEFTNRTNPANPFRVIAEPSALKLTVSGTTTIGDVISFICMGY